jgi:polar amino acid transport system substrate-binding protein
MVCQKDLAVKPRGGPVKAQLTRITRTALTCLAIGAAGLLAAGCGSSGSGSAAGTASGGTGSGGTAAASLPAGALAQPGTIRFCADISSPPLEFFGDGQTPTGSDIDLGNAIAAKLGLKAQWVNTAFVGIIPALQAGHCDAIMSQLLDKPARRAVLDFTDYMNSSQAIMVRKGNPDHVSGLNGLCGLSVAAETGTTISLDLATASKACTAAGKKAIAVQTFLRDSDALSQLGLGHVAAYGTTTETGGYDVSKNSGEFTLAGPAFGKILTGIATVKKNTALDTAIASGLAAIQKDGSYAQIMTKWGLGPDELKQA